MRGTDPLGLDPVIHERARLGLLSALAASGALPFTELREVLGLTDGNLSVHAGLLIKAGYLRQTKRFVDQRPQTTYALTPRGRRAFERYLAALQSIIDAARTETGP
ncbi:MAG: transcriptional regulator [Planctomycetes bacterium]|nr:transcriptional regulator [Planctomycetota bacterium]